MNDLFQAGTESKRDFGSRHGLLDITHQYMG